MTTYNSSRPERPGQRWAIWAAMVLGLLFLGLGAPLMAQKAAHDGAVVEAASEFEMPAAS